MSATEAAVNVKYVTAAALFAGVAGYVLGRLRRGLAVAPAELRRLEAEYRRACRLAGCQPKED